jgi:hypothetical protein
MINWISFLIQKSRDKTKRELIIIGEQGTVHNKLFTDAVSMLFGRYAISNKKISSISPADSIVSLRIRY